MNEIPKEFNEIGCRKCHQGGFWSVFTDGKGNFKARCKCGHVVSIEFHSITAMPDPAAIPLRMMI